jgi:hypothetical protein
MTCHEASAYFTLSVPIVLLQNYSIVSTSPTHCRYSSAPRLMISTWKGVAGVQPAVHVSLYIVWYLHIGDAYCKNNTFSDRLLGKCLLLVQLLQTNCDPLIKVSGKQRKHDYEFTNVSNHLHRTG